LLEGWVVLIGRNGMTPTFSKMKISTSILPPPTKPTMRHTFHQNLFHVMFLFFCTRTLSEAATVGDIWTFDNSVRVRTEHITESQIARYKANGSANLHEPEEEILFKDLLLEAPQDGIFVDVGAAIGYYCFLAHKLMPKFQIHAINPLDEFQHKLEEDAKLNGMYATDFSVWNQSSRYRPSPNEIIQHPVGVAAKSSEHVSMNSNKFGGHLVSEDEIKTNSSQALAALPGHGGIHAVTLESLVSNVLGPHNGQSIWLMMIDIQGLEKQVFQSSVNYLKRNKQIVNMIIGVHGNRINIARFIKEAIHDTGYRVLYYRRNVPFQPDGTLIITSLPIGDDRLKHVPPTHDFMNHS
jgi:FkbM family methyltransferase